MEYQDLLLEKREDGVAILTLNVPHKLNALTAPMIGALPKAAAELGEDDDVRVVILTGAGRGFCAGADVSMMPGGSPDSAGGESGGGTGDKAGDGDAGGGWGGYIPSRKQRLKVVGDSFLDIFARLEKPVIAAINGPCVGGGLSIALSCDIRIASDTARFGAAQVSRALVPDFGLSYYLPVAVGLSKASELIFTADIIDAAEAGRIGMVSRVVPGEELMATAEAMATRIAAQPPISLAISKRMLWTNRFDDLNRLVDIETWGTVVCSESDDHLASVKAFVNKQPPPKFTGR